MYAGSNGRGVQKQDKPIAASRGGRMLLGYHEREGYPIILFALFFPYWKRAT